jgi:hypothetical protein
MSQPPDYLYGRDSLWRRGIVVARTSGCSRSAADSSNEVAATSVVNARSRCSGRVRRSAQYQGLPVERTIGSSGGVFRSIVCYAMIGFALSAAVSWTCAAVVDIDRGSISTGYYVKSDEHCWFVAVHRAFGALRIWRGQRTIEEALEHKRSSVEAATQRQAEALLAEDTRALDDQLPSWSAVREEAVNPPDSADWRPEYTTEDARGWPLLDFRCGIDTFSLGIRDALRDEGGVWLPGYELVGDTLRPERGAATGPVFKLAPGDCTQGGVLLGPSNSAEPRRKPRAIPLVPIWSGLLVNTVFYGALCWLALHAVRCGVRQSRLRRDRCPSCGYRQGTSPVCTECGSPIPRRRRGSGRFGETEAAPARPSR